MRMTIQIRDLGGNNEEKNTTTHILKCGEREKKIIQQFANYL